MSDNLLQNLKNIFTAEPTEPTVAQAVKSTTNSINKVADFKWVCHVADNLHLYLHDASYVARAGNNNRKYISLGREDRNLLDEVIAGAIAEHQDEFYSWVKARLYRIADSIANDAENEMAVLQNKIDEIRTKKQD